MKKLLTLIVLTIVIISCNNSSDAGNSGTPATGTDTMSKGTPPPVIVDTPATQSDSAKVKRAIKK